MGLTNLVRGAAHSISAGSPNAKQQPVPPAAAGNGTTAGASPSASAPAAQASSDDKIPEGALADDTEVLDDEPKNIILSMISQLRPGMDLSRITFPVFVLEPRSMLERVTDFHSHPDLLHGASDLDSPEERFISVLRYYLAGWHIKPKGVKKPYNPVLGEFFRCRYDYADGTSAYYIAEQVSHHPPISAWYFASPDQGLELCGELRPKSRFLGNSVANYMEGESHVKFLTGKGAQDGEYDITMPSMYARGILFGKMVLELGDSSIVRNETTGLQCEVEFKTKGFFSGSYNLIGGKIKGRKGDVGELSGHWHDSMELQRKGTRQRETLFDARTARAVQKVVAPESQQAPNESRRLWTKVTAAIKANNDAAATEEKSAIEEAQREAARKREASGEAFQARFFKPTGKGGEWRPDFQLPAGDSKVQLEAVRQFVYGDDAEPPKAGSAANSATSSPTTSTAPLAAAPVAAAHPTPVSQPETASAVPASVRPVPRTQSTGDSDSFYDAPAASPHTVEIAKEQDPIETTTAAP
ncbi:hypothetical protein BMF94_5355 [Rhodotorula taiwanensis]|uniref:Oxysterol-binding protein n=1 Tax=Rhodotorula taiwanensis TaxID=741276 RepID=A0A2S5B4F4_9BASI|nr:hypothetical protein BMF94_5355 [Rhodotorula taiwanensis]